MCNSLDTVDDALFQAADSLFKTKKDATFPNEQFRIKKIIIERFYDHFFTGADARSQVATKLFNLTAGFCAKFDPTNEHRRNFVSLSPQI